MADTENAAPAFAPEAAREFAREMELTAEVWERPGPLTNPNLGAGLRHGAALLRAAAEAVERERERAAFRAAEAAREYSEARHAAAARGAEGERGEMAWRRLVWVMHRCGVMALYGDDGEMQCGKCLLDFKLATPEQISAVLAERAMAELNAPRPSAGPAAPLFRCDCGFVAYAEGEAGAHHDATRHILDRVPAARARDADVWNTVARAAAGTPEWVSRPVRRGDDSARASDGPAREREGWGICGAHQAQRARWIEGAWRCQVCGDACADVLPDAAALAAPEVPNV